MLTRKGIGVMTGVKLYNYSKPVQANCRESNRTVTEKLYWAKLFLRLYKLQVEEPLRNIAVTGVLAAGHQIWRNLLNWFTS